MKTSRWDLLPREVHVWSAELNAPPAQLERFWQILSPDERDRANRFRFERDKNYYVATRGWLRTLLGRYLDAAPDGLRFDYGEQGKPFLAASTGADGLQFNVSHAHGAALLAFCRGTAVGVDVEKIRPLSDAAAVAARFFSERENRAFNAVPPDRQEEAFFTCWTRKEAFIKAVGEGLSYPLSQFDVTLKPGEPARFLQIRGSAAEAAEWMLFGLRPLPEYIGAVAVRGRNWRLTLRHLDETF